MTTTTMAAPTATPMAAPIPAGDTTSSLASAPEPPQPRTIPPLDEGRARLTAPPVRVTLLEDRAQVRRAGRVQLPAGPARLVVVDVAPVLQDVSLRGEVVTGSARVVDARVRRALRVGVSERPEHVAALEEELRTVERKFRETEEEMTRADERYALVFDMMQKASAEVPEDAAWSLGHQQLWREAFESLSKRARALKEEGIARRFEAYDLVELARRLVERRKVVDRPDVAARAVIELDVTVDVPGEVEIALEYTVPNALWRPFHAAELKEAGAARTLRFASSAAVWQNTGEDWVDVELSFSTARSSLGVEPPRLRDDALAAKKKSDAVVIATREVSVQKAGLGRSAGGPAPVAVAGVELPGVDDGGEVQNLRAARRTTIPSDGRPALVPVASFESEAEHTLVAMPELEEKAFHRCRAVHTGRAPILAGPVELVRSSGFVGYTRTLFTAPGERFQVGFGPDDDVRVRRVYDEEKEVDPIDQWTKRTCTATIYVSNLSGDAKTLEIIERIPVSEIEHVRVSLLADKTTGAPTVDVDGFVTWKLEVPPNGRTKLVLVHRVELAPGVRAG